jgi:predicted ATPase/DNA-binding CsgD family transcriptional regulator
MDGATSAGSATGPPIALTSFVGRRRELDELRRLVAASRLVTLTGPGGSGKTRLAAELASSLGATLPDGIFWVSLAPITDPELVAAQIAQGVGIQRPGDQGHLDAAAAILRGRQALLVIDNFEYVLSAAPLIAGLLRATTEVRVLVTSRARLRIAGEQEFEVSPLPVPRAVDPAERAAANEAVRLFTDRATSVDPGFVADGRALADVVRIVRRLDGLPLAIELAAARVKALPPQAMVPLLEHSLPLLVGGPRDAPDRQRTLRATIEWSYELLDDDAKRLLAICGVFRGGFELGALAAISGSSPGQAANLLQELVDHSLVHRMQVPGPRFAMLETIREFAGEQLGGISGAVRAAHASLMLELCEEAAPRLAGPAVKNWLDRLDVELGNIRAALDWLEEHDQARGLRLAAALWEFWERRGHFAEGRSRLRTALKGAPLPTAGRIRALSAAGELAIDQGDLDEAQRLLAESRRLGRELKDSSGEVTALIWSARIHVFAGQMQAARPYLDRAGQLLAESGDPVAAARLRHMQGLVEFQSGHLQGAREIFEANLEHCRRIGFRSLQASTETMLGAVLANAGDLGASRASMQAALTASLDIGDHWMIHLQLTWLAGLAAAAGQPETAMRLEGAAHAFGDVHHSQLPPSQLALVESWMGPARRSLGPAAARLIAEGNKMTLEEVRTCGLPTQTEPLIEAEAADPFRPLTRRQREVARLVAEGQNNRDIAATLVVSPRTAEYHVQQILNRLGFGSRAQIAAWYAQRR